MPYYHANIYPSADNVWPYFEWYIDFINKNLPGLPILVTEVRIALRVLLSSLTKSPTS